MKFLDVVKNYGDIVRGGHILHGGVREGLDNSRAVDLPQFGEANGRPDYLGERGEVSIRQRRERLTEAHRIVYERRLFEASKIVLKGLTGTKRDRLNLEEALTTSDFPNLFGDVIDRAVLANYLETPYTWNMVAHASEVNDFRPVKRFRIDGGTGLLGNTLLGGPTTPGFASSEKTSLPSLKSQSRNSIALIKMISLLVSKHMQLKSKSSSLRYSAVKNLTNMMQFVLNTCTGQQHPSLPSIMNSIDDRILYIIDYLMIT